MTEQTLRKQLADAALAWLGRRESDGSHREILAIYNAIRPLPAGYAMKDTDPWCAAFVSAAAAKCGLTEIVFAECSCPRMAARYRAAGRWEEVDFAVPKAGDVVFYDWNGDRVPDHVGLVTEAAGDYVTVVEGNKSDAVGKRRLHLDDRRILGYGQPDFLHFAEKTGSKPDESGFDPERKKEGADAELSAQAGSGTEGASSDEGYGQPDFLHFAEKTGSKPSESGFDPERKKEGADAELSAQAGSGTEGASSDEGLPPAGEGAERSEADEGEKAPARLPLLRRGSRGEPVRAAQLLLIGRGCGCGKSGADGDFGPATYAAVLRWQRRSGLAVDGVIGARTWAALLGVSA